MACNCGEDKKKLIEHSHRYNKINLSSYYDPDGSNNDGKLKFTIPPLTSSGFAHPSKNECIIKIRKVYIGRYTDTGEESNAITWNTIDGISAGDPSYYVAEGLTLNTNIATRNQIFAQGEINGFDGITSNYRAPKSMIGCFLPPTLNKFVVPSVGANYYQIDFGNVIYQDFSKLEDSGTLASNPFGQTIEVWLSGKADYTPILPYDGAVGQIDGEVEVSLELEVMTL